MGYPGKNNNYNTVQEVVNKAASINPKSEDGLITIHIAPGTYRQQIIPYITFVNVELQNGKANLTWYYGYIYKYYSCGQDRIYNSELAQSKTSKFEASNHWGSSVILRNRASYFKAKNIVFENSLNNYMTTEEIEDGVECTWETINVERNATLDVKAKSSTERAPSISIDGSYSEFLNCEFHSCQDTVYTGTSPIYFKNCLIVGQTYYIFRS